MRRALVWRLCCAVLAAHASVAMSDPFDRPSQSPSRLVDRPNILLVIADDVGVDMLSLYGEGFELACSASGNECSEDADCPNRQCPANLPPTPTIDALASRGVVFRNAWGYPTCSPSRAAMLTGRFGFRTGVGYAGTPLPLSETSIPEALDAGTRHAYAHAAIGKWHLGGGLTGPNDHGYSHFAGTPENINNYFNWPRLVDGVQTPTTTYATTANVDDALEWIDRQTTPWFLWLAFNAPHATYHAPPDALHSYHGTTRPALPVPAGQSCAGRPPRQQRLCYSAALEALDTELGRLLGSLPTHVREKTTIVFVGDNGTPTEITSPPFVSAHAKFTIYDGGVAVPMIVSGANVVNPGRQSVALVSVTDLFATILRLAGLRDPSTVVPHGNALDSVSLWPILRDSRESVRDFLYAEQFRPVPQQDDGQTIRDGRGYKLLRFPNRASKTLELYDLRADPFEANNLYNESDPDFYGERRQSFDALSAKLESLLGR